MKRTLAATIAALAASATEAPGQFLLDGDMNALTVGTNPDVGVPAGAWQFPFNYVSAGLAEASPGQFSIVPTGSFQAGAPGNSLAMKVSVTPNDNFHLTNLFTSPIGQVPGEIVVVRFDLWVKSLPGVPTGGGAVYVGGDHGGGGFNNATDRGPQLVWLPEGTLSATIANGTNVPLMAMPYPRDAWQTVRLEIDLNTDTYDVFWTATGLPVSLVGNDLPFRSGTQNFLDRFSFVNFGAQTPVVESYLDNVSVTVIPAPGAGALLALGGLVAARRRR
jgi:hypothetical protein